MHEETHEKQICFEEREKIAAHDVWFIFRTVVYYYGQKQIQKWQSQQQHQQTTYEYFQ